MNSVSADVRKVLAVLLYVAGASAVLYVGVYRTSIVWEPIDAEFFNKYGPVYLVGMVLVCGAAFLWPRPLEADLEDDGNG